MKESRKKISFYSLVLLGIFVCMAFGGMFGLMDSAQAEPPGSEMRITANSENQINPVISGNYIVWQDDRDSSTNGWDIYMYDIATATEIPVSRYSHSHGNPGFHSTR
jgi:beta propeller repeat protein